MVIVTGSYPPDACGVGDYTYKLYDALQEIGCAPQLFHRKTWRLRDLVPYVRAIGRLDDQVVNLQYPTEGYRYSLIPQLLPFLLRRRKTVLTLHEFTRKSLKGRLASCLFFLGVDWIIFTTEEERNAVCTLAPWFRARSSIIRVGSAIPMREPQSADADLTYFGLLRPGKGLETFADVVSMLAGQRSIKARVVGQVVAGYEEYARDICNRFVPEITQLILNQDEHTVGDYLSRTKIALLPFPDGMSFRRTSAFATMGNGALLVTTPPLHDKEQWDAVCVSASGVAALAREVEEALDNPERFEPTRLAGFMLARNLEWASIARQYQQVTEALEQRNSR